MFPTFIFIHVFSAESPCTETKLVNYVPSFYILCMACAYVCSVCNMRGPLFFPFVQLYLMVGVSLVCTHAWLTGLYGCVHLTHVYQCMPICKFRVFLLTGLYALMMVHLKMSFQHPLYDVHGSMVQFKYLFVAFAY
jgi:hypothetical protein